jgi:nucleoside phosphorylase
MVNATRATETALARFPSSVDAVVFSGVAGGAGRTGIADVAVPARWTQDNGATFHPVDPGMLAAAENLSVALKSVRARWYQPQLVCGGDGCSYDNNNGQAFPCIPNGGRVFGCQARKVPDRSFFYTGNFFQAAWPWLKHGLISNANFVSSADPAFDATDSETAAVQAVADAHGVPFLGIRGMSDGPGDPLHLPGFPFQFFVYKKVAAANAARVTATFLQNWPGV